MQFQILAVLSFVAFTFAAPVGAYISPLHNQQLDFHRHMLKDGWIPQIHLRSIHSHTHSTNIRHESGLTFYPAQATQAQPSGEAAAMSDASGNVVAFDPASVSLRKLTCLQHFRYGC
jgi:hypothetical protein